MTALLALELFAFILAAAALVQSDGKNLAAWGVLLLALVLVLSR